MTSHQLLRGNSWGKLRAHLRSTAVAYIALFFALATGSAYAANTVFSADIVDGEVKTRDLALGAVNHARIANDATTGLKVKDGTLAGRDVLDNSLRGADIDESTLTNIGGGGPAGGDLTGTYPSPQIASNAVGGGEVADGSLGGVDVAANSLGGAQIQESALGQVPSALLGGYGRWMVDRSCNPQTFTFIDCGFITLDLPSASRVLMIGAATGTRESGTTVLGFCRLVTSLGVLEGSAMPAAASSTAESIGLTAITEPLGPGSVDFGVECREDGPDISFQHIQLSAVALSPG